MTEVTIFTPLPACEVCGKEAEPKKKRCKRCSERYDSYGVAYVIYCDFYRFGLRQAQPDKPENTVTLWVCDGKVQRAPEQYKQLVGKTDEEAVELICAEGYGLEIWAAQVK